MISRRSLLPSLALLAALVAASPTFAQDAATPPPDQLHTMSRQQLDIVKLLLNQERAWNAGNLDAYTSAYKDSPGTVFVADTSTHGFANLVADFHHNYPTRESMGTLTFSHLEPQPLDEKFATLIGHYHLERNKKQGGNADGVFSLVLEKTDQGWKIILDHRT